MNALLWLSQYSALLICGLGLIAGGLGVYIALKRERGDRWTPPRTRYPRR